LLVALSLASGQNPGVKTTISVDGMKYFLKVGIELLEQALLNLKIPDLSGDASTPVGNIDWTLTNIDLSQFTIQNSSVILDNQPQGVQINIIYVDITISMDWSYREVHWPHISDHGSADISSSTSAGVDTQVTTQNFRPQLLVLNDIVIIGKLDITLHGGASWLYQLFIDLFSGLIKTAVTNAIQQAITQNIDQGVNKALSSLVIQANIGKYIEINYELLGNPTITPTYFTIPELGEFYDIANPKECPCDRPALPDQVKGEMIEIMISEFMPSSLGFAVFSTGLLKVKVSQKDLPHWSPISLNTTDWFYLLPNLYKQWPNQLMFMNIYATQGPALDFSASNGATVTSYGELEMRVITSNGSAQAFVIGFEFSGAATVDLDQDFLIANVTYISGNFSVTSSNIGPFDISLLENLLNLLFSKGIVPLVDTVLNIGVPLPTIDGLSFVDPNIGYNDGYMYISSSFNYVPPSGKHFMTIG